MDLITSVMKSGQCLWSLPWNNWSYSKYLWTSGAASCAVSSKRL